ncbi:MAG: DUF2070 family protein [Candidatus Thorarchaeota archaeon]
MYIQKQSSRQIPGIISYLELFSSRKLAYSIFFGIPLLFGLISLLIHTFLIGYLEVYHFFRFVALFLLISGLSALFSIIFFSKKAPILRPPPHGWSVQMNVYFSAVIELTFIFGQIIAILLNNILYQEIFLLLGTIIAYAIAFIIYYSFTTVGRQGYLLLSLAQPVATIGLYALYTGQFNPDFFIKAIIFFTGCALLFAIPYRRGIFRVSNVYREATGISGYPFIRAFILSMMTEGNDTLIESFFDRVGIKSKVKIQYLIIRSTKTKDIKGLMITPHIHFGPFKTCGSSDLPEMIT